MLGYFSGLGNLKWGAPPSVQSLGDGKITSRASEGTPCIPAFGKRRHSIPRPGYPHSIGCLTPIGMLQDLVKEVLEELQSPWGPQSNPSEEEQNLQEQSIVGHQ